MDQPGGRIVWDRMPTRATWLAIALGVLLGGALGAALGWVAWGRRTEAMAEHLAALESTAAQVQGERDHLHRELDDIVRERRAMAATAEELRAQVDAQLRRLEALSAELAPPPDAPP
jgi:uncharacterized protein HemX